MATNVFLTTLSTLPYNLGLCRAVWEPDGTTLRYYLQQRPGFVFSREKILGADKSFDKIIVLCSNEVLAPDGVSREKQQTLFGQVIDETGVSVFRAFRYQLEHDTQYADDEIIEGDSKCPEGIVEEFRIAENNIRDLIARITERKDGDPEDDAVDLYIDTQGGSRTTNLLMQAVLSIADRGSSKIKIKSIVAGDGNNRTGFTYKNVRNDYDILTLVSGMNAFLQYGKSDLIQTYVKRMKPSGEVRTLADKMVGVDRAISVCDATGMVRSIQDLDAYLHNDHAFASPFNFLATEIKAEFDSVMCGNEVDIPKLIIWMKNKQFYQQALTLCEASMPGWIFSSHGKMRYEYDYAAEGYASDAEFWDNWVLPDAQGHRTEEYRKNDHAHFIFERLLYCRQDNWQPANIRFSLYVKGNRVITRGERRRVAWRHVSQNPELAAVLSRYRLIKKVRNTVNHASATQEEDLKKIYPNRTFQDSAAVIIACIDEFLDAYDML